MRHRLILFAFSACLLAAQPPASAPSGAPTDPPATPATSLAELSAGNGRFVDGRRLRTVDTGRDAAMRAALLHGQRPIAVIVTCSDSRVPDALVFDQEAGRLFTIREAGNALDSQGLASVEYAVDHLGSRVVVVMGHSGCGAVKAVRDAGGRPLPGHLWSLQAGLAGLLEAVPKGPGEDDRTYAARLEEANAHRQAQALLDRSERVRQLAAAGKVWVVPALYHLETGRVQFFPPARASAAAAH